MRESIPRQMDKKSRVPKEEKGVWGSWSGDRGLEFSRRRKGQFFFSLHSLVLVNYTTQFKLCTRDYTASLVAQMVKHLPAMGETWVWSLGLEDPLEKEMATYSSTLAWKILWMEKPGRLPSMGSQRVGHDWVTSLYRKNCHFFTYTEFYVTETNYLGFP